MARRKAERPAERGVPRAETNAVAAHLAALRTPKVPARSRTNLERPRAQIERWLSEESSPKRGVTASRGTTTATGLGGTGGDPQRGVGQWSAPCALSPAPS
jgi:hypothetical protein